jgi:ribonuclease BN (tRNA processing enzyme)
LKVRVLGAHKLESRHARHTCFLIDGVLGLDAGSLASSLDAAEQGRVQVVLLTHQHFDHIRDLPTLGLSTMGDGRTIDLYGLPETHQALHGHLLNRDLYPDLTEPLGPEPPKFKLRSVEPKKGFTAIDYSVSPIAVPHAVPNVGYVVRANSGGAVAYTGDTDGDISDFFKDDLAADVVFVEVTFPNRLEEQARITKHMTPAGLRSHLAGALKAGLQVPKMVAVHISLEYQDEIMEQIASVAEELSIDLIPGYEDMELEV